MADKSKYTPKGRLTMSLHRPLLFMKLYVIAINTTTANTTVMSNDLKNAIRDSRKAFNKLVIRNNTSDNIGYLKIEMARIIETNKITIIKSILVTPFHFYSHLKTLFSTSTCKLTP
jgi:hypothetical protein